MVAARWLWVATSGEIPVLIQRRPNSAVAERCRSGRTGRSRKPLSLLRGTEGSNPSLSANESVAAARVPGRRRGATPPSSHSQISDTTPEQVTCCSPVVAAEALAAFRSYPTAGEPALPGSVGQQCFRSSPTVDGPPFPCGALTPVHGGASAASPMWRPPAQEPSPVAVLSAVDPLPGTGFRPAVANWTAAKRGRVRPVGAHLVGVRPRQGRCAGRRLVRQTRARR